MGKPLTVRHRLVALYLLTQYNFIFPHTKKWVEIIPEINVDKYDFGLFYILSKPDGRAFIKSVTRDISISFIGQTQACSNSCVFWMRMSGKTVLRADFENDTAEVLCA